MYYQRTMLYRVLDSFLRHKWLFIVSAGTVLALVLAFSVLRPVKFVTAYTIVVSSNATHNPLSQVDTNDNGSQILDRTVRQMQALISTKRFMRTALTGPDGKPAYLNNPINVENADQLAALQKDITVTADGTDSFTIQLTYGNPDDTLTILNGIIAAYIRRDADEKTSYFSQQVAFLTQQVADYKDKLTNAEGSLARWKKDHPEGDPAGMAGSQQDLENLRQRRDELRVQISSTQERIAVLQQQLAGTPKKIIAMERVSQAGISPLQARLEEMKDELAEDMDVKGMTADHPVVVALNKQIARLRQRIAAQRSGGHVDTQDLQPNPIYDGLQNQLLQTSIDLRSLQTEISDTNRRLGTATVRVSNNPDFERALAGLTRNYRIYDQNYNTLLDRLEQARMNEQINRRQVTDQYQILLTQQPTSVTKGKKAIMLYVGGFFIAMMIGIGLVLLSEWMDRSLRDPIDAQNALGVPVLALLPEMQAVGGDKKMLGGRGPGDAPKVLTAEKQTKKKKWSAFMNSGSTNEAGKD
ncbi:MAG TPA: hypothetical protein VGK19_08060 [Capsulimonadaceae bacterium]|jgi:uncharacterized protein involved in exopolysaccharide biosynthesis